MAEAKPHATGYRWAILFVVCLAHCFWNIAYIQPGGLAQWYFGAGDFAFTPMEFSMCMNAPFLTAGLFGLVFGAIADRRGVKAITAIGTIAGVLGLAMRAFVIGDFPLMFAASFLSGFGLAGLNANAVKIIAAWFPLDRVSTMMGVYIASCTLGAAIALGTGALFSSLFDAFAASAGLGVVVAFAWILLLRNRPAGAPVPDPEPTADYLRIVASKRLVWLAGIAAALFIAFGTTQNSYLTTALTSLQGADLAAAGFVGSVVNVAVICGSLFWPWFANKIGRFRVAALGAVAAAAFTVLAIFVVPFGTATYVLYFLVGFGAGGGCPIVMAMPALIPGVGEKYAGTAGGLISTIMNLAAFVLPSLVIAPLFASDMAVLFSVVVAGYVLFAVSLFVIPELGRKGKLRASRPACD